MNSEPMEIDSRPPRVNGLRFKMDGAGPETGLLTLFLLVALAPSLSLLSIFGVTRTIPWGRTRPADYVSAAHAFHEMLGVGHFIMDQRPATLERLLLAGNSS